MRILALIFALQSSAFAGACPLIENNRNPSRNIAKECAGLREYLVAIKKRQQELNGWLSGASQQQRDVVAGEIVILKERIRKCEACGL